MSHPEVNEHGFPQMSEVQIETVMLASVSVGEIEEDEWRQCVEHAQHLFADSLLWKLVSEGKVAIRIINGEPHYRAVPPEVPHGK